MSVKRYTMLPHAHRVRSVSRSRPDLPQPTQQRKLSIRDPASPLPLTFAWHSISQYGLGTAVPVPRLADVFDGSLALVWADGTNGTGSNPSAHDIISRITTGFSSKQLSAVRQLDSPADIPTACPQNFNLFSECFAAVAFNSLPGPNGSLPLNYTLRADGGLFHIDVTKHNSDYEKRLLPLQWAIDSVCALVGDASRLCS